MNIANMRVISVDDNHINLKIIEVHATSLGLNIISFTSPSEALNSFEEFGCDLIITDYMMPEIDGLEVIKRVRQKDKSVPIIMLTAVGDDIELQIRALELGATDFLNKPINAPALKARITNLLTLRKSQLLIQDRALLLEEEVKKATQTIIEREHEALILLAKTAEYKDPETRAHSARVAHYSKMLAKAVGLDEDIQDIIFYASPFHDIGKVGIADSILLKPARLNQEEFEIMKKHTTIGFDILKDSKSKYLQAGAIISLTHHEKWDGSGYPNGLKEQEIHIFGRIVAITDVFDALTSNRPYKKAWPFDDAISFLIEQKGKHFDPLLIELFIKHKNEIKEIFDSIKE